MDSFEEIIEIDSEDFKSLPRFRDNTAVVSNSDNSLLMHTSILNSESNCGNRNI